MCNGSIMDKLISFSLPLMLSGILQLMFNAVDIIVVGQFTGSQALAAVGSTTALIAVFTNLFIGISLGANVLAARFYASGKHKEMSETVHTSITLALISGIIMAFVGLLFSRTALEIMSTPDNVIDQSTLYMKIYFLGMPFFMLYNYGAAILRAVGDTKRPLIFLIISGLANAGLNLLLVIVFDMGVAGVAIGTVVSQFISCVLSASFGRKLSALFFKADHQKFLSETDFSGWCTCRNPEHSYQSFQCIITVLCQFIRFNRNGRIYSSQQYLRIFIYFCKLHYTVMHEFHQPELRSAEDKTYG